MITDNFIQDKFPSNSTVPNTHYMGYVRSQPGLTNVLNIPADGILPGQTIKSEPVVVLTEAQKKQTSEALRFDSNKTNWSLMPFEAVEEINKVLDFGANKYAEWNWTKGGGMNHSRVINSCLRHIFAYMRGEDKDPESGLSHLAHAGCNILFLLYYKKYPEIFNKDDRRSKTGA
jgi:hypothetical protein